MEKPHVLAFGGANMQQENTEKGATHLRFRSAERKGNKEQPPKVFAVGEGKADKIKYEALKVWGFVRTSVFPRSSAHPGFQTCDARSQCSQSSFL